MATNPAIKPRRGTSTPGAGAILQHELAIDTTNKRIFIGAADGSGTLVGSAPGGSDTQIQFNDGGNLGGDSGLTYNKTTDALTMAGDLNLNGGGIKSNEATVSILPSTVTTLNIGGAATALNLGTTTGTTTINSPTVVGSQTTQALFDTVATTMNFARTATSITMGAATGTTAIRNPTVRIGNTTGQITTNTTASTNHLTLQPCGKLMIVPTLLTINAGSIPSITVENTDGATGVVEIAGGDLFLTRKTADDATFTPVNIIFEGATNNTNETTLTVEEPTADRTITLPDAGGTVGVMASPTNQQIQFYDSGTKNLKGDADLIFDGTNLQIGSQGDLRLADSDSSNYVAFQAPATVSDNNIYTLPSAVGSANQVLQIASVAGNDATLQWATVSGSGSPGGSDTYVQFNDGSTFGGDAGFTYNKTTDSVTLAGDIAVNGGDITTSATVASLFDATATTISIGTSVATTVSIGANANGAAVNMCNGNITFTRTGSGMLVYSNLVDGSINGMNIKCNGTGSPIQIGDVDGALNSTILMVNDSAGTITFYTGTGSYAFPTTNGSSGQALTTNGSGTLSWSTVFARSVNNISTTTSAGSAANTDYVYNVTSGTFTLTMPTAVSNANRYSIKQSGTGTLTIATTSSQTIDGSSTYTINAQYQSIDLISDGANWIIV